MKDGTFFWRRDIQFGRIKGDNGNNGEAVIFDEDNTDHDLNLKKEHKGTPVKYKAQKVHGIPNTFFATEVRKV